MLRASRRTEPQTIQRVNERRIIKEIVRLYRLSPMLIGWPVDWGVGPSVYVVLIASSKRHTVSSTYSHTVRALVLV